MKKLLIFILALIALAVLGWFAIYKLKAPAIETDILKRSSDALSSNSLDWANVKVDGRDITLSGEAPSEQMKQHALDTANVYGVRQLSDEIVVSAAAVEQAEVEESEPVVEEAAEKQEVVSKDEKPAEEDSADNGSDNKQVAEKTDSAADVEVAKVDIKANAIPYKMNISKDDVGVYVFEGVVPNPEFKQAVDAHLQSLGADPVKARWQVDVSSETPPANWQENTLKSISALQLLQQGDVNFEGDQALVKGVAASQDASDQAEAFVQSLSSDFAATDVDFDIATPKQVAQSVESVPMVGSSTYAEKFCQTEFNGLLKQEKIQFQSGSTELEQSSVALLEKVAQVAGRCPDHQIQVHGYTDSNGAAATNKKLSKSRAEAVTGVLAGLGLAEKRLLAVGHGEAKPIASNKTEKGRAQNRRIELIVKGLK